MADELRALDIMTDGVIAIDQDASVQEAARQMRDENIRSLVVLDDGEAVGIVVGRDLVYGVVADSKGAESTPVSAVMSTDLVTASSDDAVGDIARSMLNNEISRVPIIEGNQLVGIITQTNIVRAWPAYTDLLQEESQLFTPNGMSASEPESAAGECARCENYSEELVNVNGEFLCPECQSEL